MKPKIIYWKLAASVFICQLAGIIGAFFTVSSVATWYAELIKPGFNPPSWIFSPVWITLYFLMGISLYTLLNKASKTPVYFFGIQLGLNTLWSIIFFGLRYPFLAFIEIVLLWISILLTIIYSYKSSKLAAYLMVPYIIWVSFAVILNFFIFYLNI